MPNLSLHIASTEEAVPNLALHVAIIKLVIAYTLLGAKRRDMTARLSFNTACDFGVVSVLVIADLTSGTGRFNFTQGVVATATGLGASL
jgi:hypothetical protein